MGNPNTQKTAEQIAAEAEAKRLAQLKADEEAAKKKAEAKKAEPYRPTWMKKGEAHKQAMTAQTKALLEADGWSETDYTPEA